MRDLVVSFQHTFPRRRDGIIPMAPIDFSTGFLHLGSCTISMNSRPARKVGFRFVAPDALLRAHARVPELYARVPELHDRVPDTF